MDTVLQEQCWQCGAKLLQDQDGWKYCWECDDPVPWEWEEEHLEAEGQAGWEEAMPNVPRRFVAGVRLEQRGLTAKGNLVVEVVQGKGHGGWWDEVKKELEGIGFRVGPREEEVYLDKALSPVHRPENADDPPG